MWIFFFFFQAEDGIRDVAVTGVQTCALPIFRRLGEQRHVSTVEQGQLRAGNGLQAELLRSLRECHRAVQPVVVGEGERVVAELRRGERQLLGERGAVEKREGGGAGGL